MTNGASKEVNSLRFFIGSLLSLLLSGCFIANDIATAIVNDSGPVSFNTVCIISNCTNSNADVVSDIRTSYVVTQKNGKVTITASIGQTANLLTAVAITGGDSLTATVDGQAATFQSTPDTGTPYTAIVPDASLQPVVVVNFQRGASVYPSTVTLPPSFVMLSPMGTVNLGKSAGKLQVQLSLSPMATIGAVVNMQCNRADSTSFSAQDAVPVSYVANTNNSFAIYTSDLDVVLNGASQTPNNQGVSNISPVTTCGLTIDWQTKVYGTVSSGLYRSSYIVGIQSVQNQVNYDSRL